MVIRRFWTRREAAIRRHRDFATLTLCDSAIIFLMMQCIHAAIENIKLLIRTISVLQNSTARRIFPITKVARAASILTRCTGN